jgi:CrcB protein
VGTVGLAQPFPQWPLGTLAANLIGSYLIGIAIAFFFAPRTLAEWQLFAITGCSAV